MTVKIEDLEKRIARIEKIIWYVAGVISIKMGYDIMPFVSGFFG